MKKILLFILVLFISKSYSQREDELSKNIIIKNKISEIKVFNLDFPRHYLSQHLYYDKFGNVLQYILFHKNGIAFIKHSYQYNEKQQRISSLNEMDNIISISKYNYDKSENLIEYKEVIKSDSTLLVHNKMTYNERNQMIKIFKKKKNSNDFYLKENRFYNNNGSESKRENFKESETLFSTEEFEYDKNRKLIFLYRMIDGKKATTKFSYNKKGELVKTDFPSGGYVKYKYDKFGNRISEINYSKSELDFQLPNKKYEYKTFE